MALSRFPKTVFGASTHFLKEWRGCVESLRSFAKCFSVRFRYSDLKKVSPGVERLCHWK